MFVFEFDWVIGYFWDPGPVNSRLLRSPALFGADGEHRLRDRISRLGRKISFNKRPALQALLLILPTNTELH